MALQERKRAGVEGFDVLVDRCVRAVLEHHKFGVAVKDVSPEDARAT